MAPACAAGRQIGQRPHAAGRIGRRGAQQLGELMGRARIEPAIGAAREPRDLAERLFGDRIVRPPGT